MSKRYSPRRNRAYLLWLVLALVAVFCCFLRWGGFLLVAQDPLPSHAAGAVVMEGSFSGERARLDEAIHLLQQGTVDRLLLSVPRESYWGQRIFPLVESFIESNYGQAVASRVDFCESDPEVDSTQEEAGVLAECIRERGWRSVVVVTSDYHTRRAGIIWRKTTRQEHLDIKLSVHAAADPDFRAVGWWRHRRFAKTWVLEFAKLCEMLMSNP